MSASDRRRRRRVEPTDEWEREKALPGSVEAFFYPVGRGVGCVGYYPCEHGLLTSFLTPRK